MEDAERCGYMVVEQDEEKPASDDQEEEFLERLPINAGRFWLPVTFEDLKEDQETQLSIFLLRWRRITTGNKMMRLMRQTKGPIALMPLSVATKKVVWRQGVQVTPDPMSQLPGGSQFCFLKLPGRFQSAWRDGSKLRKEIDPIAKPDKQRH